MRMKKFLTFLLTIAMVMSLLPATAFAANTATTMRLEKTQGTVTVTNGTGKNVTKTDNMKLYNGYKIKTGAKSYAWISLDDTKVAKLDANSTVEVQKKGNDLTLYISSGNMFFNVKKPLKGGENLQIKTSTMTTGIRGTSGCVRVISPRVTEVHLLTGEVLIYVEHPEMGISKSAMLQAGQKATSLIDWEALAVSGEMVEIVVELLQNHEICGICSKEIAEDPELLERIAVEAPHLLPEKAAAEADERLAADEAEAEEKQAAIDTAVSEQVFPEDVDPYFENESGGGGGGGGSSEPAPEPETVSSWEEFLMKLQEFNGGDEDMTIELTADIPTAEEREAGIADIYPVIEDNGSTLTLDLSDYYLALPGDLTNQGDLIITNSNGYIGTYGAEAGNVAFVNEGTATLKNGTIITSNSGDTSGVYNQGEFIMEGGAIRSGEIMIDESGDYYFERIQDSVDFENQYTTGIGVSVNDGGTFKMKGGIIEAGDCVIVFEGSSAEIIDGTLTSLCLDDTTVSILENASAKIKGGNFTTANTIVENYGTLEMTGGTMNLTEPGTYGVRSYGYATLSGGRIDISADAGTSETDEGAIGVLAGGSLENTMVMNGTKVYANDGTAVYLEGGTITLAEGAVIHALTTEARAVRTAYGDNDALAVNRPVGAEIIAIAYHETPEELENTIFEPLYAGMTVKSEASGDNFKHTLTDNFGKVTDGQTLAEAISQFNQGNGNATITLEADIDMTSAENANVVLESIGTEGTTKILTLDLNGHELILREAMENYAGLIVTDTSGGSISSAASTVLLNRSNLTLEAGTLSVSRTDETGGIGVENLGGEVVLNGATIAVDEPQGTGIFAEGGSILIDGGSIQVNGGAAQGIVSVNEPVEMVMTSGTITVNGDWYEEESPDGTLISYSSGIGVNGDCTLLIKEENAQDEAKILVYGDMAVGISNGGTTTLNGCYILASAAAGQSATGVENSGTLYLEDGDIYANAADGATARGILNAEGTEDSLVQMNGGTVTAGSDYDTADVVAVENGGTLQLFGGKITANENATAVDNEPYTGTTTLEMGDTVILAKADDRVLIGDRPAGYDIVETDNNYFTLATDGVNTEAEMVAAINAFNDSTENEDMTITLTGDIVITETVTVLQNDGGGTGVLTLDLNGYDISVELTDPDADTGILLVANDMVIKGEGTISGTGVNHQSLIVVDTDASLTWNDATMEVSSGQIGIYNYGTTDVNSGHFIVNAGENTYGSAMGIVYTDELNLNADDSLFEGDGIYKQDQAGII